MVASFCFYSLIYRPFAYQFYENIQILFSSYRINGILSSLRTNRYNLCDGV